MKPMIRLLLPLFVAALAVPVQAQVPVKIYAQELVDRTVAQNRDVLVAAMHVTPPKSDGNIVIASNIGRLGKPGDEDDLRVIATGETRVKVARSGERISIDIALRDATGDTVGSLGLVWPYRAGEDTAQYERKAQAIRDTLARRILNTGNLMDPFPFDPSATTKTRAQKLVDEAQERQPEVRVLALRGHNRASGELVLLGSTFGRHGKKADADDLKILAGTEPVTGVYSNGRRFGVDLPLRDAGGSAVGTMNVGYAYRTGDDQQALLAKAVALRDELQRRIANTPALDELDP
ncbi:hypothetical protein [Polaromonas jejuensis]|uniref:Uncharacterized protein n=1 Tax=Polaromonas jejuensis TaxID=457502 RepID=A0ABW0Q705_9BURK|nr:hypothetical protein [Polaromonas jejuensis]